MVWHTQTSCNECFLLCSKQCLLPKQDMRLRQTGQEMLLLNIKLEILCGWILGTIQLITHPRSWMLRMLNSKSHKWFLPTHTGWTLLGIFTTSSMSPSCVQWQTTHYPHSTWMTLSYQPFKKNRAMRNGKLKKFQIPNWTDVAVDNQGESTWSNGKDTTRELGSQKNLLNRQLRWTSLLPNSQRNTTHHPTKKKMEKCFTGVQP